MRPMAALLLALLCTSAQAQLFQRLFNPEVRVTLTHPPGLGIKVTRLAFAPTDSRSEELVSAFMADLSASGKVEIVDRGNLDRLLQEQKFSNSGLVDGDTAVELGKLLGAPVLMNVKVHTFKTQELPLTRAYSWKDDQGVEHQGTRFTSRTQVDLSVTVQAVDCKTGKVYSAQRLVANQAREAVSVHGEPAFPSRAEVQDLAFADVTRDLRRMLLGWEEVRSLIFYDDKDYGMKEAYQKLKAGDYRSALVKSLEARDKAFGDAMARPKHRSRTSYNLGMCSFILGDYDAALPCLRAACEVEPANGIFNESLKECLKALRLREEMAKVDSRSSAAKVEAVAPDPAGKSLEDRLQVLERLKEKGLLTPEEYRRRKDELLKEI